MGKVVERLSYDKIEEIFKQGLHSYLNDFSDMFGLIGSDIARNYFYYVVVHESLSPDPCYRVRL